MQAVILVGGKGRRLRPLTDTRPKPMMTVVDRPFVAHQLDHLQRHGVTDVVFSCGYLPDALRDHFGDGRDRRLSIRYVVDPEPLGTAGAVRNAWPELDQTEATLVLNGDVLTDIDLGSVLERHRGRDADGTIVLTPVPDPGPFGLVRLFSDDSVEAFVEKPKPDELRPGEPFRINAGTYVLEPGLVEGIPHGLECSIEREVFPAVAAEGRLYGHPSNAYWLDIGTPAAYLSANQDVLAGRVLTDSPTGAAYAAPEAEVDPGACIEGGTVIGARAHIAGGARIAGSVLGCDVHVGSGVELSGCIGGANVTVGEGARIGEDVVIGDGAIIAAGTRLNGPAKVPTEGVVDDDGVRESEHARR